MIKYLNLALKELQDKQSKITYEYGSHKDNHETFIDILLCLSVGKLDFKGY